MPLLRVASFNVLAEAYMRPAYYPDVAEFPDPPRRRATVVSTVLELARDADVICCCEADSDFVHLLEGRLGGDWNLRWTRRPGGRTDGSLVATRAALRVSFESLTHSRGDLAAAVAHVEVDHRCLAVVSTHLGWAEQGTVDHVGVAQARWLADAVASPSLLVGDLNDAPGGDVFAALDELGWRGPTRPPAPTHRSQHGSHPLDWVLARGDDVTVESLVTVGDLDALPPLPAAVFGSDHLPVLAEIR